MCPPWIHVLLVPCHSSLFHKWVSVIESCLLCKFHEHTVTLKTPQRWGVLYSHPSPLRKFTQLRRHKTTQLTHPKRALCRVMRWAMLIGEGRSLLGYPPLGLIVFDRLASRHWLCLARWNQWWSLCLTNWWIRVRIPLTQLRRLKLCPRSWKFLEAHQGVLRVHQGQGKWGWLDALWD